MASHFARFALVLFLLFLNSLCALAAVTATYNFIDRGWNFCGPSQFGCTPPSSGYVLSLSAAESAADMTAQGNTCAGLSWNKFEAAWSSGDAFAANASRQSRYGSPTGTLCSMPMSRNNCGPGGIYDSVSKLCKVTVCPQYSHLTGTTCACDTGFGESGGACVALPGSCTSTDYIGSPAYFDYGTAPNNTSALSAYTCINSCGASWVGTSPASSSLVAGVRHYYGYGRYQYTGDGVACTVGVGGANISQPSVTTITSGTCAAGQNSVTINGVTKCFSNTGAAVAETVSLPTKTTTNSTVTNGDGSKTVTTTITNNQTGISTVTTTNYASGVTVPVLPTSTTTPIGDPNNQDGTDCGTPGKLPCGVKVDETGTDAGTGAATADTVMSSINSAKTAADAAVSSGNMSAFGIPNFTSPIVTGTEPSFGLSGSDTCTDPTGTYRGQAITWPMCQIFTPIKPILAWMLNVFLALYAWSAYARRNKKQG